MAGHGKETHTHSPLARMIYRMQRQASSEVPAATLKVIPLRALEALVQEVDEQRKDLSADPSGPSVSLAEPSAVVQEVDEQREDVGTDQGGPSVSLSHPTARRRGALRRHLLMCDFGAAAVVGSIAASRALWVELGMVALWWLWMTVRLDRGRRIPELLDTGPLMRRFGLWMGLSASVGVFLMGSVARAQFVIVAISTLFAAAWLSRRVVSRSVHLQDIIGFRMRESLLLVGDRNEVARTLREWVRVDAIEVVGVCLPESDQGPPVVEGYPVLGAARDIVSICQRHPVDAVALHDVGDLGGRRLARLQWALEQSKTFVSLVTPIANTAVQRVNARAAGRRLIVDIAPATPSGAVVVLRSMLDRVAASILLVAVLPILLTAMLVIRATSCGPAIFRQVRVRENNRTFVMYKLRTMTIDAEVVRRSLAELNEAGGGLFKIRQDPRVTKVGRLLRQFSLDELPQLVNVIKGEMALVGPRPALPSEVASYNDMARRRLAVKPGLTGLWQVSGRSDLSWEESVRIDMDYVDNWSPGLDAYIAIGTVRAVLWRRGAY